MPTHRQINLHLSPELLAAVDALAGDVPRNRWIRRVLEREVERAEEYERMRRDGHAFDPPLHYPDLMFTAAVDIGEDDPLCATDDGRVRPWVLSQDPMSALCGYAVSPAAAGAVVRAAEGYARRPQGGE